MISGIEKTTINYTKNLYALSIFSHLSTKPELPSKVLLHHIIRELDTKVSTGSFRWYHLLHH